MGRKFCLAISAPFHGLCLKSGDTQQNAALGPERGHYDYGGSAGSRCTLRAGPGPLRCKGKSLESACLPACLLVPLLFLTRVTQGNHSASLSFLIRRMGIAIKQTLWGAARRI